MFIDTETDFASHNEGCEFYTTCGDSASTNKAIADAKRQFEAKHGIDKHKLTARKVEDSYDWHRDESYRTIAVGPNLTQRHYR
jgi:hypothetical protein